MKNIKIISAAFDIILPFDFLDVILQEVISEVREIWLGIMFLDLLAN
jgi:hypothetical protein